MVATIRNWAFDTNHVVAGANEDAQAQDNWFRVLELFRGNVGVDDNGVATSAGAWTVQSSSDSVTANTSDNITASTNIVFASAGNPHSWIVFQRVFGARTLYVCIDFNDAASPFRTAQVILFPAAPTVAGTTTNRPTHPNQASMSNSTFFNGSGFTPRHVHGWRSEIGEIWVAMSVDGSSIAETAFGVARPDAGEAGILWPVHAFYGHSSLIANRGAYGIATIDSSATWLGFWQDDTPITATRNLPTILGTNTASWANGRSNIGANPIADAPFDFVWDSATEAGYVGRIIDMRAAPSNVPNNEIQTGDNDIVVRTTIGEMWFPIRRLAPPPVL